MTVCEQAACGQANRNARRYSMKTAGEALHHHNFYIMATLTANPKLSDIQTIVPVYKQTWLRVTERYDLYDEGCNNIVAKEWHSMVLDVLAFGFISTPYYLLEHVYFTMNPDSPESPCWLFKPENLPNVVVEVFVGEKPDTSKPIKSFCEGYTYVCEEGVPVETVDYSLYWITSDHSL